MQIIIKYEGPGYGAAYYYGQGGGAAILNKVLNNSMTDADMVRAIYGERGREDGAGNLVHFRDKKFYKGLRNRFQNEMNDALGMLGGATLSMPNRPTASTTPNGQVQPTQNNEDIWAQIAQLYALQGLALAANRPERPQISREEGLARPSDSTIYNPSTPKVEITDYMPMLQSQAQQNANTIAAMSTGLVRPGTGLQWNNAYM